MYSKINCRPGAVAALLSVFLFAVSCQRSKVADETDTAFTLSDTMMSRCEFQDVAMEPVRNELRLFGKITADNSKMAQVYPVVGGIVTSINIELGDYVKQGQILATIQSSEVAQFHKEKLDAINEVAIAEKNLEAANDLFSGKLNSERDVAIAQKELEHAKTELSRINDIYKIYSLKSGSLYNIQAPISGFVITKRITQNEQLPSAMSEPLFAIAEINEVWALANVNETEMSSVKVGFDADIRTLAFPDRVYHGKIDKVFNAIDPETKSMKARVKIVNTDLNLKPEMNCTVSVGFTETKTMIAVPSSAIIFDKSKYWVMVFKDRHNIETRQVIVYRQLGELTYVSEGLITGERVITRNGLLVYDAIND